jgi:Uma2 family endonuclease
MRLLGKKRGQLRRAKRKESLGSLNGAPPLERDPHLPRRLPCRSLSLRRRAVGIDSRERILLSPENRPCLSDGRPLVPLRISPLPWQNRDVPRPAADKRQQPLEACDTLLAKDAGMVTDLQSRRFPFDTAHRFTLEEYYRLVEDGLLEEDARVELLDGKIIPMSPVGPRHEGVLFRLNQALADQARGRFQMDKARPLPIPDHNEPQPDLMLFRVGAVSDEHHVQPADVFLVVEVAKSTRRRDLIKKARIYAGGKVPEYWVVDLKKNFLHVFTLEGDGYKERVLEQGSASPRAFPDVTIDLNFVFHVRRG